MLVPQLRLYWVLILKAGEKLTVEKLVAVPKRIHILQKSMPLLNSISSGISSESSVKYVLLRLYF